MGQALVRCVKCNASKFEGEVRLDSVHKDYVCKDETNCSEQVNKVQKMRGRRMGTVKLPTYKNNMQ